MEASKASSWGVQYQNLLAAVQIHYSQKADDRCWEDDQKLYFAAGLTSCDRSVGDKFEMLKNCVRFIDRRCEGGNWPTYAELEAERDRLKELVYNLETNCDPAGTVRALGLTKDENAALKIAMTNVIAERDRLRKDV